MKREARRHGGEDQPARADNLLAGGGHRAPVPDMFQHVGDEQRPEAARLQGCADGRIHDVAGQVDAVRLLQIAVDDRDPGRAQRREQLALDMRLGLLAEGAGGGAEVQQGRNLALCQQDFPEPYRLSLEHGRKGATPLTLSSRAWRVRITR